MPKAKLSAKPTKREAKRNRHVPLTCQYMPTDSFGRGEGVSVKSKATAKHEREPERLRIAGEPPKAGSILGAFTQLELFPAAAPRKEAYAS